MPNAPTFLWVFEGLRYYHEARLNINSIVYIQCHVHLANLHGSTYQFWSGSLHLELTVLTFDLDLNQVGRLTCL